MSDLAPLDRDHLLQEIRTILPAPVNEETQLDGSHVFVRGDPGEVVVRVHGNQVTVAIFAVVWDGPCSSVRRPQTIGTLNWKRLPTSCLMLCLQNLIQSAREIRLSQYRKCEWCDETNPPEWMSDEKTCHSCAERYLGVVH